MIKAAFNLKVDPFPSDFIIEVNLSTYRLTLVDKDDEAEPAPVATVLTIVVPFTPTTEGGDEVKPSLVVAATIVVLPVPTTLVETTLAPRGSSWVSPCN